MEYLALLVVVLVTVGGISAFRADYSASGRVQNRFGNVATLYEIVEGNDYGGESPFKGTDIAVLRKALTILQASGKCVVIDGASPEEDGVKFA